MTAENPFLSHGEKFGGPQKPSRKKRDKPTASAKDRALQEKEDLRRDYRRAKRKEWEGAIAEWPVLQAIDLYLSEISLEQAGKFLKYVRFIEPSIPRDIKARHMAVTLCDKHCHRLRREAGLDPYDDPLPPELGGRPSVFNIAQSIILRWEAE